MTKEELQNSERYVDYFLSHIENLQKLSRTEGRDVIQLTSFTAVHCRERYLRNKCFDLLYYCCFFLELDLKEMWNIYWILNHATFADCNTRITGTLDELYKFIFAKVLKSITESYENIEDSNNNLIIMITSQFLGVQHAPTRRILDYSYTIATELHKQVMIINDSGVNFYPCACIEQDFRPNYIADYNKTRVIKYKDLEIPFMQIPTYMPDLYCLNETLQKISQLQPALVYNIGGSSLLADLCTLFTKTACFPCSTNIPISMSKYLLVGRKVDVEDNDCINRLEPYQQIIETVVNYQLPDSTEKYERSTFGIQNEDFVLGIVGNRLDIEIDDDFLLLLNQILEGMDIHILFVGAIHDTGRIKGAIDRVEKLHFAGSLPEASQAMELFDVYCNPKRNGGGRSSFEALAHGVPVITLKYGDVYHTCGDDFAVDTYDDYVKQIECYFARQEYLNELKDKALQRASYLSNLAATQGEILRKIL